MPAPSFTVKCPRCGAPPGQLCVVAGVPDIILTSHQERIKAALNPKS